MGDLAIRIQGLSKQYRLGQRESYRALRDVIARRAARTVAMFRTRQSVEVRRPGFIWALKNVSFDVRQGDVVGIIGRNGAGKSTLLKVLARITEPTTGEIDVYGRIGSLLEVGTGFHGELT